MRKESLLLLLYRLVGWLVGWVRFLFLHWCMVGMVGMVLPGITTNSNERATACSTVKKTLFPLYSFFFPLSSFLMLAVRCVCCACYTIVLYYCQIACMSLRLAHRLTAQPDYVLVVLHSFLFVNLRHSFT